MILKPTATIGIDAYPDADFAGLYGYEDYNDPVCVRSCTVYVITVAGCPIFWSSNLQTKTATSTMEAEIIALGSCCCELLPIIIALIDEIGVAVGIKNPDDNNSDSSTMHITIHEDNRGALILQLLRLLSLLLAANTMPSKQWFHEQIIKKKIKIAPIDMRLQLGDIFTKMLSQVTFKFLRNLLLQGW
jgi:hypothetical protein